MYSSDSWTVRFYMSNVTLRNDGDLEISGDDKSIPGAAVDRQRNQRILITLSYWATTLAEGSARIIIPLYFAEIGFSPFSIGLSFFFFEAFGLLANIYSGFFINYYGYKRAFLISLLLHTVASLGYLLIFPEQGMILSLVLVSALRACRGIGKEVIKTASSAYIRQFAPPERRAFGMPIQILLGGKDSIKGLGIVLGGFLLTYLNFKLSFLALGLVTLAFLLIAARWVDDYRERKQVTYAGFFDVNRKLSLLAWSRALLYAGRDFWLVIPVPLYMNELGFSNVSIATVLAVGLIVSGIAQPLSADQVKRIWTFFGLTLKPKLRYRGVAITGNLALFLVSVATLIWHQDETLFVLAILGYHLVMGIATMPHNYLHLKYAKRKRASVDITHYKTVAQLGKVVAVPASGLAYGLYGIEGCLIAATVSIFAATVLIILIGRKGTRDNVLSAITKASRLAP